VTATLLEQKTHSMTDTDKWWLDVLQAGVLPPGCAGERECSKQLLAWWYHGHGRTRNSRKVRASQTELGIYFKAVLPGLIKSDARSECRFANGFTNPREWTYRFPELAICRAKFEDRVGQKIVWADEDPELFDEAPADLEELDLKGGSTAVRRDWEKAPGLQVRPTDGLDDPAG